MIFVSGIDGDRLYVSREWTELTGQPVAESLGRGWLDRVHLDDRDIVLSSIRSAIDQQSEFSVRYRLLKPDGVFRWVGIGGVPSYGPPNKSFIGYLGSLTELADTEVDAIKAYGNVGRFVPFPTHPNTVGYDELDRVADCLLLAHSLIETDVAKGALPAVRAALVEVGFALATRARETRLSS